VTSPPRLWKTSRAAKRAALIGLAMMPIAMLLHPEDVRSIISQYKYGDWGSLAGTISGYLLGAAIAYSVPVALICTARNFIVSLPFAQRLGRFPRAVLCTTAAGIALCGLVAAVVATALVGNALGGSQVATWSPLVVLGGGWLLWFLRARGRAFVAAARDL